MHGVVQGTTTSSSAYAPKYVASADMQTFGKPSDVSADQYPGGSRPYVPFEGESVTKSAYPYVPCNAVAVQSRAVTHAVSPHAVVTRMHAVLD